MEKGEIAQNEQFHLFPQCFSRKMYFKSLIATFQLSYAASLNLGLSQNGELGNGLTQRQANHELLHDLIMKIDT